MARINEKVGGRCPWGKLGAIGALGTVIGFCLAVALLRRTCVCQPLSGVSQRSQSQTNRSDEAASPVVGTASPAGATRCDVTDFERVTNRRFGFYTYCPKTWDILISQNGDGFSCQCPENPDVEISAYGNHLWQVFFDPEAPVADLSKMSGYDVIRHRVGQSKESLVAIIDEAPTGVRVDDQAGKVTDPEFGDRVFTVSGRRIEYEKKSNSGKGSRILEKVGVYEGVAYTIRCSAPRDRFEEHRWLFRKMLGDFRILTVGLELRQPEESESAASGASSAE